MKKKIGDLYTTIENGNSLTGSLGLMMGINKRIPIEFIIHTPSYGPSGVCLNNKTYKIIVYGDYVNKTHIEMMGVPLGSPLGTPVYMLEEISDIVEGIPNRIFTGQELLISYAGKPIGSGGIDYGPTYGLTYDENLAEMENDVNVKVMNVSSDGSFTYIDVLSPIHLYWIDDLNGSEIVLNFKERLTNMINKNYPKDLYMTNLHFDDLTGKAIVDFYFTNTIPDAKKFKIAYRRKTFSGNTEWVYVDNILKSPYQISDLEPNEKYEIRVMTFFDNTDSVFSPGITFKTI